jgi:hypothetical protein
MRLRDTEQMRKQYHFRRNFSGLDAWDVDRLIALVEHEPIEEVRLEDIVEIDTDYWFDHGYQPTVRKVVEHCRLIHEVNLDYPIVIDPDGRVMDGMHRVARSLLEGRATIMARRLPRLPEPDYRNTQPDELSY